MQQGILPSRAPGTSHTEMMLYATWFLTYVVQSCANLFNPQASFPFEAARELTKYLLPFIFAALCWSCCLRAGNLASTRKNGVRCHGKDWTVNIGQTKDDPDGGKASDKFGDRGDNILHHTGGGCFCHPKVPTRPDGTPPHVLHAIQIWLNISSMDEDKCLCAACAIQLYVIIMDHLAHSFSDPPGSSSFDVKGDAPFFPLPVPRNTAGQSLFYYDETMTPVQGKATTKVYAEVVNAEKARQLNGVALDDLDECSSREHTWKVGAMIFSAMLKMTQNESARLGHHCEKSLKAVAHLPHLCKSCHPAPPSPVCHPHPTSLPASC